MTGLRYKAFISYSHRDEKWASWLHKVLESYRLPRQLVGRTTRYGMVPAKLYPVFRDRDELSTGSSLSERVRDALEESESLIVICSPAAAASRWVNEEIRAFRALGRGDRIYCIIVDGDPQAGNTEDACFPPALLESDQGATIEPLAADPRDWADGKTLAKLKLISGVLGVRLDELRQREMKRRRLRQLFYAFAGTIVIGLGVATIVLKVKENARRENAEALVSQMVDISKDLNNIVDLETQRSLAERLQNYLTTVSESDLAPQSRFQLALVLRQLGNISRSQAQLEEALNLFTRSQEVLMRLAAEHPDSSDELFELGQAEFWIGYIHTERGDWNMAEEAMNKYLSVSRTLQEADPKNAEWAMEMAYALTNLGAIEKRRNPVDAAQVLQNMKSAMEYNQKAVELDSGNDYYKVELAESHANLGDAWLAVCRLGEALTSRIENVDYARRFYLEEPANNQLKMRLAFALSGLSGVQRSVGLIAESEARLEESISLLDALVGEDYGNLTWRWNLHRKRARLASLLAHTDREQDSWSMSANVESELRKLLQEDQDFSVENFVGFAEFLLHYSALAYDRGDKVLAARWLDEAIERLQSILDENPESDIAQDQMRRATYQYWTQNDQQLPADQSLMAYARIPDTEEVLACDDAAIAARLNIIQGDKKAARDYTQYLLGRGFYEPEFARFCREQELCDES